MKNITLFLKKINTKDIFIAIVLMFYSTFSYSQVDLRTCGFNCTSNNYTLKDVYLSFEGVNGEPINNTTCTIGETKTVYVYLNYTSNSGSNIYHVRLQSDLTRDGQVIPIDLYMGTVSPGAGKNMIYTFNWTCGESISLTNTLIAWVTNDSNKLGANLPYDCNSYSSAQCDFTNLAIVSSPLAVQYTYKACKEGNNTTVSFTDITNGGTAPYSYSWNFGDGSPISTVANPVHTFTGPIVNKPRLTVTDSNPISPVSNFYELDIIAPSELTLAAVPTHISCGTGSTGAINLTASGGNPGYTYLWTGTGVIPANEDQSNLAAGNYNVTVTDSNGCQKSLQVTIDGGDTTKPVVTAPTNTLIEGCSVANAGTLAFSTIAVSISTETFTQIGGSITDASSIQSITYQDTQSGTCPIVITRTFTVTDLCGNFGTATQTITIQDTIDPTWTTVATNLDRTIECSNTAALATAQALAPVATDNCSTVTYTKVSGAFVTGTCANSGTYTNTWIAKDVCLNESTTFTQVITIEDNTDPTWTTAATALNRTIECSDTAALATAQALTPVATDNCSTVTYTKVSGAFVASFCANSGTYTNTWIAKDVCLNESTTFTQIITIQDTTDPSWTTAATTLDRTIECSDTAALETAQALAPVATDNCSTVTYTKASGTFVAGSCANSGTYTNTWIAKDVCLNESTTFTQVITIQDTTDPTWTTAATDLNTTIECSDTAALATAQALAPVATDNCSTVTYTKVSGAFVAGTCANSGTYTNTWIAKDVCLNESTTFTQVITIQDTTDPIWTTTATNLDRTIECSDTAALTAAQALAPVATDNCSTVTYTKVSGAFVAGSCANSGTYTNTWIAKDVCLNESTTFTQVITIQDTTDPTWTTSATNLNRTIECSNTAAIAAAQALAPVATDNCSTVTYTKVSGDFVAGSCANSGTYTNTWIAKDVCLNESTTFTQVITIQDTTDPTWTTAATNLNRTIECSDTAALETAQALAPVATDNCSTVTYTKVSGAFVAGSCANSGTYTNTWIAKDVCLNESTTFTQIISIQDTTDPTWTTAATALNTTIECSDTASLETAQALAPVATDNCSTVTYTKVSGAFVVGSCPNSGTYTNTWIAKDVCLNESTTFTQVITIQDTTAPTWTTPAGTLDVALEFSDTAALATAQAAFPVAADLCDADVNNIVKVSGAFVPSQGCANAGTYTNTWTVKDACGNTSEVFTQVITIGDAIPPTWTTLAGALDTTVECSDTVALATAQAAYPIATDLSDTDVTNIVKVPGVFVPSEGCTNAGTYTNTWTVSDDCGNTSAVFTQVITVEDTTAPTWTTAVATLNTTVECSDTAALATAQAAFPIAADLCDADVSNIVKVAGSFVASEGCANAGTYTNTWTVKDDCGNTSAIFTQIITIEDTTAPNWTTAAAALNTTVECSDAAALATAQAAFPVAADLCDADVSNIVKVAGSFVASEGCANAGTYTNTWTVKDDCDNTSAIFTQVITVEDTTAPTWTTAAAALNTTVECSDAAALATAQAAFPVAADLCDADVSNIVKIAGSFVASEGCANAGTYTNTWTVKDDCGNTSAVFTQIITIEDTTAPTWTTAAAALNTTVECSDAAALATAQAAFPVAADLCDADVSNIVKVAGSFVASEGCANAGTYTNTWTVKDDCDNTSAIFTQVITVEDTTAPTWTTVAAALNTTVECSDTAALATAQAAFPVATDLCDADVSNIVKIAGAFVASEDCANAGTYTNTWTVKDACGNTSAVFTQVITIEDTTAPTWTTAAAALNTTIECSDAAALATAQAAFPVATDLCDVDVTNIVKVAGVFVPSQGCGNAGTYTNTWTVNDDCDNTSVVFTQVITVEDTTAPTWTTAAAALNTTVECSDTAALETAQAAFPVAADLCDVDITNIVKVPGVFVPSEGCANAGTYTNTWTVKDDCGNTSAVFTQVITIEDSTAPVVTSCATDQTVASNSSCEAIVPDFTSTIQVSDNCTPSAALIITQSPAAGSVVTSGTTTVIITAEDDCGNKVTCEAKLTVTNFIVANDDAGSPVNSYTGGISFTNVLTNDLLNCTVVNPQDVAITTVSSTHPGITLNGADVVVAAGTPAGSYTLIYQICEIANNTNCDQATVTVTVTATPIDAVDDNASTFDGSNGVPNILNVFTNDTLNNIAVNPAEVTLTTVIPNNNLILNPDGSVDVLPGTPQGIYELTYQICENAVPGNCDQAVVSITVALPRMANSAPNLFRTINCDDTIFSVNPLLTVTINDQPVSIDKVTIKLIAGINSSITLDDTGSVNIANGLPVGNYKLLYQVCEKLNPDNCITGFITITVQDINKPVFTALPAPKTISCDEPVIFEPAIATDTCSAVLLTHEDVTVLGSCPGSYTITRTWTATDATGNFSNASQIIIVEDKTGPTTAAPFIASIDANCNDIPSADLVTFTDNCSEVTQEEFTENIINPTQSSYSIVRKWVVTDSCENTSEFTQVINVSIANSVVNINSEACNADSSTVNLSDKLPAGTPTNGVWTALSNAASLNGSIFSPFGLATDTYAFEYKILDEFCPRSIIVNMEVNDDCRVLACNTVKVHNAFSPNGDGRNDTFVIANINDECYTGNSIEIYNRWGVLVFDTKDYNNESNYFDGTSRGRSTINQSSGLPTGTYFYILNYSYLDVNDTIVSKKEDGYLYLSK